MNNTLNLSVLALVQQGSVEKALPKNLVNYIESLSQCYYVAYVLCINKKTKILETVKPYNGKAILGKDFLKKEVKDLYDRESPVIQTARRFDSHEILIYLTGFTEKGES